MTAYKSPRVAFPIRPPKSWLKKDLDEVLGVCFIIDFKVEINSWFIIPSSSIDKFDFWYTSEVAIGCATGLFFSSAKR